MFRLILKRCKCSEAFREMLWDLNMAGPCLILRRPGYSGVCAIYNDSAGGGVTEIFTGEIDQVDSEEGRSDPW